MPEFTRHEAGSFSWVELATTDTAAAKAFYGSLFGWTSVDTPAGPDMVYTRLQLRGMDVGALYPQPAEQRAHGAPPSWTSYVTVESADQSAARARELGATVAVEPFDVMQHGRMAVVCDPAGAFLALWEPREHKGVQIRDEPNTLCWNELYTKDTAAAARFYTGLFGWTPRTDAGGYTEWLRGSVAVGGMIAIAPEWGKVPPHWLPYFSVDDCDGIVARAEGLGGRPTMPARDVAHVGRFALLRDPQGASFAVIRLERAG
jgi:predicted enzyme related to lactoylglutathione lyase